MNKPAFNNRVRGVSATLAHAEKYVFPAALVTYIATLLLGPRHFILDVVYTAVAMAYGAILLASFVHDHDATLCLPCIKEVPADAPVRAQRRKIVLWFIHFAGRRKVQAVVLSSVIFGPQLLLLALHVQPSDVTAMASTPGIAWGFAVAFAASQHRQLRPWCSYCRGWDEHGDHEPSPDPVTFGTKTTH